MASTSQTHTLELVLRRSVVAASKALVEEPLVEVYAGRHLVGRDPALTDQLDVQGGPSGGHGFGIRESHKPSATWDARMLEWMADRKLMP